ncbi:MAG: energy-coupling factor transporter transmembrane component T, partial [Actinomycetota bacterium]
DTQLALLFGGVLAAGNIQRPKLGSTPLDASVDFFAIAAPSSDRLYGADGEREDERVLTWPLSSGVNLGWQYTAFQKAQFQYQFRFDAYVRDRTTSEAFELPFIAFALFLPLVGQGERVDVAGMSLSVEGLWGLWNITAKATLGLGISIVAASTTTMPEFLRGFDRLHVPRAFTSIASFMIRYGDVISDEMRRMRVARESRGFRGRWIWQARAVASSAGTLFIRSYERGERVYLAMLSRGYTGSMPGGRADGANTSAWVVSLSLPGMAALVALVAWWGTR